MVAYFIRKKKQFYFFNFILFSHVNSHIKKYYSINKNTCLIIFDIVVILQKEDFALTRMPNAIFEKINHCQFAHHIISLFYEFAVCLIRNIRAENT